MTECEKPHELTLTPTIPVRVGTVTGGLLVRFYLPDGLWMVDKDKCYVELKGTTPVTVNIGATCTTLWGRKKLKVITPKITNDPDTLSFWAYMGLPTVWVYILDRFGCRYYCSRRVVPVSIQ